MSSGNPLASGRFSGRRIVVGVTGGIAAYKTCYLVRELIRGGAEVQVVMSRAGTEFVAPLTFATLSGRSVLTEIFPSEQPTDPIHLTPASWGELMVVAPATANFIGKLTHGLADDIPSTVGMAFRGPILIAPAMNPKMWSSPAVVENMEILRRRGVFVIGPDEGSMGGVREEGGVGRMSEPDLIADRIEELLYDRRDLVRLKVVVASGPTREAIDPVRFISNRSSGVMGDSIAREALKRGAEVVLIRGKGAIGNPPTGVRLIEVDSAAEMASVVKLESSTAAIVVMAAAVADWTVANASPTKLKKSDGAPVIEWRQTEDILASLGRNSSNRGNLVIVGFALETKDHLEHAQAKLKAKSADLIVLNDPTRPDSAFGGDSTRITLLDRNGGVVECEVTSKQLAARNILDAAVGLQRS